MYDFFISSSPDTHNSLLATAVYKDIFQTAAWSNTARTTGWGESLFFSLIDKSSGQTIISAVGNINKINRLGNYLYILHGPIFAEHLLAGPIGAPNKTWGNVNFANQSAKEAAESFLNGLKEYGKQQNLVAVSIEALADEACNFSQVLTAMQFANQKRNILPVHPLFMDLTINEEELLARTEKNTRYYIRYAEKQGVQIEFHYSTAQESEQTRKLISDNFEFFKSCAQEKGQKIPSLNFFLETVKQFEPNPNIFLAIARHEGKIVSANFSQIFGDWAGSYYTFNGRQFSKLRASYLLKWATIIEAQKHGAKVFDMWGHMPDISENHPEYGYGQFKRGFSPVARTFAGRKTLVLNKQKFWLWQNWSEFKRKLT